MPRQTKAAKLQEYRNLISTSARDALRNGASAEEVNAALQECGLPPVAAHGGEDRQARYQARVWVIVNTPDMAQDEAEAELNRYIDNNNSVGFIDDSDDVEGHEVVPGTIQWRETDDDDWSDTDTFWQRQTTPTTDLPQVETLDALKAIVRKHFLKMASVHGWSCSTFTNAWRRLELGDVPTRRSQVREVPVSGTVRISVTTWEGASPEEVEALVAARASALGSTYVDSIQVNGPSQPRDY